MPRELVLRFPPSAEPLAARDPERLRRAAARELRVDPRRLAEVRLRRLSFDARRRRRDWRVVVDVFERGESVPPGPATTPPELPRPHGRAPRVVVVGSGPAGLFCALDLLAAGINVTVLERGGDVRERRRPIAALNRAGEVDRESNYCFGEGGAGTFSDGKLYTRSCKRGSIRGVLETLVAHGADAEILASWRPHVGSNRLPEVVRALRETILSAGGEVRFHARAEALVTAPGHGVCGLVVRDLVTGLRARLDAAAVVLAAGHSAPDAVRMAAAAGARLEPKGFAMGVRAEHRQDWLDEHQYGGLRERCELPASFYELSEEVDGRGVYSFCMCPGGFVVPATTAPERVVLNGMSLARRDSPFANSGVVVGVEPADWCGARGAEWGWPALLRAVGLPDELPASPEEAPRFGQRLQAALERRAARGGGGKQRAPAQRADLFAADAREAGEALPTSYRPGVTAVDLGELLPRGLSARLRAGLAVFDRSIPGFAGESGQLLGVETRTSSPVRVAREPETCEAVGAPRLYPAGEGAGYAGGIVSAALDGQRVAAALARVLA